MSQRRWYGPLALVVVVLSVACAAPARLEPGDFRLDVEGGSIFYRVVGSGAGTPVILLHGGPGYTAHYLEPLQALGDDRPVVLYDQLGSGRSDRVTDTTLFQADRYVRELDSLRHALGLERVHLYGHSWGTMLAIEYVAAHPEGVESLVLASPVISTESWAADARRLLATLPDSIQAVIATHEAAGTTSSQAYQDAAFVYMLQYVLGMEPPFPVEVDSAFAGYNPLVYETMWGPSEFSPVGNLRGFDRSDFLRTLTIPVLFTAGRNDEAVPATVERFAALVPGAEVRIFEASAHLAMITERDAYVEAVRGFLRRTGR